MLDWLIVGGGIHGTYLSRLLVGTGGAGADYLRVLDVHREPLAAWRRRSDGCGMLFLRSPITHHLDLDILSLYRFAREAGRDRNEFAAPYNRPSLALFNDHCSHVIATHRLDALRVVGRAVAVRPCAAGLRVETSTGEWRTRRLLLAIGFEERLHVPDWAETLPAKRVCHALGPDFERRELASSPSVAIVGGGISAAHLALTLAVETTAAITLLSRHALRRSIYDFDPCWIGPKCLNQYYRTGFDGRRDMITSARVVGTVTPEAADALEAAVAAGRVAWRQGRIRGACERRGAVYLDVEGETVEVDRIVLATGFSRARPGGDLVDQMARDFSLTVAACGYPALGDDLRWHDRIYLAGPLAELAVGPTAPNIIGARNAGRLLLHGLGRAPAPSFLPVETLRQKAIFSGGRRSGT